LTAQHPPRWIKFAADAHATSPCLDAQARFFFFFFLIRENTRAILGGRRAESRGDARRAGSSRIGIINFTSRLINVIERSQVGSDYDSPSNRLVGPIRPRVHARAYRIGAKGKASRQGTADEPRDWFRHRGTALFLQ